MTEAEWLARADPQKVLGALKEQISDRKRRLLAVAFCRQAWGLLTHRQLRRAVEVAERFADGEATAEELGRAHDEALQVSVMLVWAECSLGALSAGERPFPDAPGIAWGLVRSRGPETSPGRSRSGRPPPTRPWASWPTWSATWQATPSAACRSSPAG